MLRVLYLVRWLLSVALDLILGLLESVVLQMATLYGTRLILECWLLQARFVVRLLLVDLCILIRASRLNQSRIMVTNIDHLILDIVGPVV